MQEEKREEASGYRTAFKATGILGGVQMITVIIGIIKTKLIALWIGPSGFGLLSIFNSIVSLISSISNLGLASSAVRDISIANTVGEDKTELAHTIKAINRSVFITGLIGAVFTVLFSSQISVLAFQSNERIYSVMALGFVVFINGVYGGQYATLQGTRRISDMAKARIWGSLYATALTLPLYYFLQNKGIIVALVLTSLLTLVISHYYVLKVKLPHVEQSFKESFQRSSTTLKLGVMMAISGISVSVVEFALKTFISSQGGVEDVGFYQAGWTLNASYLGLVFGAMATDYFPRLSAIAEDNALLNKRINEQAEIATLILAPLIALMICFMPIVIRILYTEEFGCIELMTKLLMFGSLIKASSWAISFVFLAKGAGKTYLFNELVIKLLNIPMYFVGYYKWGIDGIGYAFIINYIVYFTLVYIVSYKKYKITYYKLYFILCLKLIMMFSLLLVISHITSNKIVTMIAEMIVTAFIVFYSFYLLNKRLLILNYITKKYNNGK